MQAYSEILPPTAVTHAVRISFTGRKAQNLVVARTSLLQIFDVKLLSSNHGLNGTQSDGERFESHSQTRLVLIAEFPLSGIITSLAAVKLLNTKSGGQALLVALKDAKLSLVEWDPDNYALSTISIHLYEGDGAQDSPWAPSPSYKWIEIVDSA